MLHRRDFLKGAALLALAPHLSVPARAADFVSGRPEFAKRAFSSPAVEARIDEVKKLIGDPELAWMFENCYPNTLDTTVKLAGKTDTFVITGDIDAMWLRDSSAQVWPYLPLAKADPSLQDLYRGLIARQARCVLLDPYANAFTLDPTASGPHGSDKTDHLPGVFERKYELDSLCYVLRLAHGYWKATDDLSPFDDKWRDAAWLAVKTMRAQQRKEDDGPYHFQRLSDSPTETLYRGVGYPTRPVGLIHTGFRPSDDAGIYTFLVPANHFAVVALRGLSDLAVALKQTSLALEATALADEVNQALKLYGTAEHPKRGTIVAYEVDGFGSTALMDDANVPSLLSLAYLGALERTDPLYQRTRGYSLSTDNPYYYEGKLAHGNGSPHTGPNRVWPVAITMRALTSRDSGEIRDCLAMLKRTHNGTGFMHEAFDPDDAAKFSRPWFAWANSIFGELIVTLADRSPDLLK
jgi:meiotically up-regulated gene 157 (Mug157) protein